MLVMHYGTLNLTVFVTRVADESHYGGDPEAGPRRGDVRAGLPQVLHVPPAVRHGHAPAAPPALPPHVLRRVHHDILQGRLHGFLYDPKQSCFETKYETQCTSFRE